MRCGFLLLLILVGCSETPPTLILQVRTDLVPGRGFSRLQVTGAGIEETSPADPTQDWGLGVRVLQSSTLGSGDHQILVSALDAAGRVVVERPVRFDLGSGVRVVTVLLSSRCVGVSCPGSGDDPAEIACLAGRCVSDECSEETPELCDDPECVRAEDCPVPGGGECARAECTPSGSCFALSDRMCPTGEICVPETGCVAEACTDQVFVVTTGGRSEATFAPALVWTGSSLLVAWRDGSGDVVGQRLDQSGALIGGVIVIGPVGETGVAAVGTGDGAGLVWEDGGDTAWWRLSSAGIGTANDRALMARNPSLTWTGADLALIYEVGGPPSNIGLELTASPGLDARYTSGLESVDPSLVWAGTQFFVVWRELGASEPLCFRRADGTGTVLGSRACLPALLSSRPATSTDGAELAIAWRGEAEVQLRTFGPGGAAGVTLEIAGESEAMTAPAIAYDGTGYGIVWAGSGLAMFATVSGGSLAGLPRTLNTDANQVLSPVSIASGPGGYFVAFHSDGGDGCCDVRVAHVCDVGATP